MDVRTYWRAVRKYWWVVVLTVVIGLGVGAWNISRTAATYSSSVTFFVSTPASDSGTSGSVTADEYAQRRVDSYIKLMNSDVLAQRIVATTSVGLSESAVKHKISASSDLNTVLLTATVVDTSAQRAHDIAQGIATQFPIVVQNLEGQNAKAATAIVLHVTSGPSLNHTPIGPRKKIDLGLGLVVGLVVGLIIAVLRGVLDTSMRSGEDVQSVTSEALLASIRFDRKARNAPLVALGDERSPRGEAFRQLRTNLQFLDATHPARVLVVTSSVAGEGKSSTSANLALVFARAGQRVLLVEADLRRPRVSDYLEVERIVGLSNVLAGQIDVDEVLQPWGDSGVTVLPSGSIPPNPSELLGSPAMHALLAHVRRQFDVIVIDSPPLLPVTDAAVIATQADGVIAVVRYGKTRATQINAALDSLRAVDARIVGCVLNMMPAKKGLSGGYESYGYHEDSPVPDRAARRRRSEDGIPASEYISPQTPTGQGRR